MNPPERISENHDSKNDTGRIEKAIREKFAEEHAAELKAYEKAYAMLMRLKRKRKRTVPVWQNID